MAEECTHDCASCSQNCEHASGGITHEKPHDLSDIRKVIAVVSGKGGVGKSIVTSTLSVLMMRKEKKTAILDADITGPSIPKAFGLTEKAQGAEDGIYPVQTKNGINVMSLNLLVENETDPVLWRGPVIAGAVTQFWKDVIWGNVDFMFVDMPPGTGDVPLTVFQSLPIDGIVIVTSPQELVSMIVEKAVNMAKMMNVPILGIVENMSYFKCPDCGKEHKIFGESHIEEIAEKHNIKTVAKLPMDPEFAALCDKGMIEEVICPELEDLANVIESL